MIKEEREKMTVIKEMRDRKTAHWAMTHWRTMLYLAQSEVKLAEPFHQTVVLGNLKRRAFVSLVDKLNYRKDKQFAREYYLDSLLETIWQALQLNAN